MHGQTIELLSMDDKFEPKLAAENARVLIEDKREAEKAIVHLHTMGITRIAVVHVDDSFGADGLAGAQRRAGPKLSRERVQTALEGLRKHDIGGLEVGYGPNDHTGLDFADLSIIGSDGRFKR